MTAGTGPVCPASARVVRAELVAVPSPDLSTTGAALVAAVDATAPGRAGPAVLHVGVGDCLRVRLQNRLTDQPVLLRAGLLVGDPADRPVPPRGTGEVSFYAPPTLGEAVAELRDAARPIDGPGRGLYGAVVVTAAGSSYRDPAGHGLSSGAPGAHVVVRPPHGPAYRDLTVFPHDTDGELGTHQMPYRHQVVGTEALSYVRGTQVLLAYPGDPLRLHVVAAVSEQLQGFSLDGHRWPREPGAPGSAVVATQALGGREVMTAEPLGGAGGEAHLPGDYVYGASRGPYRDAGVWGVLRVLPKHGSGLSPLNRPSSRPGIAVAVVALLVLLLVLGGGWSRTRKRADGRSDAPAR